MGVLRVGYQCADGLFLPGVHADAVRAALGVFRLLESVHGPEEAMARAVWTYLSVLASIDPDDTLALWNRMALRKHVRRLVASGKGTPEEVLAQLAGEMAP
jgi:hypothetical protein